ncbi:AKAP7 2'5' RNA ligase-like domain-containing protein [Delphinella strobiligena]|nr:AKAP7 2'5' RNA ligase-like domain-containing protein [Delphinella strobiligena]
MIYARRPFTLIVSLSSESCMFSSRHFSAISSSRHLSSRVMPRHYKKSSNNTGGGGASKKPPLTHFFCIPLVNSTSESQLESSIYRFKEDVCTGKASTSANATSDAGHSLSTSNPSVIAEKAIRPVGALHLTLGVMSLDENKLASAIDLLNQTDISTLLHEAKEGLPSDPQPQTSLSNPVHGFGQSSDQPTTLTRPISPPGTRNRNRKENPLVVSLKSLTSMHPPHKTSILYTAPSDPTSRLQPLCEALRKRFQEAGFLIEDTRPLKLHATLVNTIYVKGRKKQSREKRQTQQKDAETINTGTKKSQAPEQPKPSTEEENDRSQGHGPDAKAPLRIDARDILDRYKDFVWAENISLDRVAICEMGAKKISNEKGEVIREEYKEVATTWLPGV